MKKLPDPEGIREIARRYALDCKASGTRPTLTGVAAWFGRAPRWLTTSSTPTSSRVRSIVLKTWMETGIFPAANLHPDIPRATPRRRMVIEDPPAPVPESPLVGNELLIVLSHPERLRQFCLLAESAGIGAALGYAQQIWRLHYAPDTAAKDAA